MPESNAIPPHICFGSVFHALPGLYLVMAPDLTILDVTEAYLRALFLRREDIVNKNILATFPDTANASHSNARQELEQSLDHVLRHRQPHTMPVLRYDLPLPAENGGAFEQHYWNTTHTPVFLAGGEIAYILQQTRDITHQVRQEQKVRYSQAQLSMLTSAAHAVAWEYDLLQDRLHWGTGLKEVLGYTPEEMGLDGHSWNSRVHPEDYAAMQESITKATAAGEKTWTGEYRFLKADGTYAHVLDQGYIIYDENNRAVRTIGSIMDVSRSKLAEQELEESNSRFRHLLEVLPHMAWTADAQGGSLFFNENWYSYTGMRRGQTDGWISVVHPDDSAQVLTVWHEAIVKGQMFEMEYRVRNALDGSYRWFLERGVPMSGADGRPTLWMGTFTDIEEQKQALQQLQQKDLQMENVLRLSPAHLCLLKGPSHICRYVTPGVYNLYGNRQYLGRTAREIWPELQRLGFQDLLDQVYQKGDTVQISEFKAEVDRYRNGRLQEAYFNFKYQPLLENGEVEGILISAVEVTELVEAKRRAEALAQAQRRQ
ncbi:PAS domain-containing protein [Pontibacter russatus]|uniref:PAS domain-containing protein n=1 Tax=Pontibacter russatus TaxID=2694929 RepID=UPI00137B2656|nr:PAS domain-containing protein [Pontibacter russatus]